MSPRLSMPICAPGMPGISKVGRLAAALSCTSTSISLSSSAPSRSILRNFWRVSALAFGADQRVEHALLGGELGLGARPPCAAARGSCAMRDLDEVAHDLLDVAADIADLGELGRLDLEERRLGELRQAARDLGLAARRSGRSSGCSWAAPPRAARAASCWRRQRLRSAMATARLASFWPTMKRSSSETISRGLKDGHRRSGTSAGFSMVILSLV